jgi:hypothetical protein
MVQSMHSLYAYGRAFDVGLMAAAAVAAAAVIAVACACVLPGRCAGWKRRRAQRRYVRTGMRELERYLGSAPRTRGPRSR